MKTITKIIATSAAVVALFFTTTANAQQNLGIGLNVGLPTTDGYNLALGADLRYQINVDKQLSIPITAGYTHFIAKDIDFAGGTIDGQDFGYIPVKAGVKYFFDPSGSGVYGLAELGAGIGVTPSGAKTGFLYAPSIGYSWSSGLDLGVRYEGNSVSGGTLGQVALRLAYGFKL